MRMDFWLPDEKNPVKLLILKKIEAKDGRHYE